jgi:dipeptidyl aminopeptidase/acylaminoacyl peptidase
MKQIFSLLLLLTQTLSFSQSDILLEQTLAIEDWSTYPIYERLTEDHDGTRQWKPAYAYLDSIDVYGITYLSDGLKVNGLLVTPKAPGKYPCIIFNRGGNRDFGALTAEVNGIRLGQIAKEGYVVIASQYRGNGGSEGMEQFGGDDVHDVTILPNVLAEVEQADTSRIGMYGWSRGGMMSYIAITQMGNLKAAAVGGALADLTIIDREEMETHVYAELIPNYETEKDIQLKNRSAVYWVDKFPKDVPILMLHGNADWRVLCNNSLRMAAEFDQYRIPYRLKIFEGGDHGLTEFRDEVNDEVIRWFDRFVKNGEPLPNMEMHGN